MGQIAAEARASALVLDGALALMPGNTAGAYRGDQPIFYHHSGLLDGVNAVSLQNGLYFSFYALIISIKARVRTAAGTASAHYFVGTSADNDKFADITAATTDAAGTILTGTILNGGTISPDDLVVFGSDGGATATGDADVTVLFVPRTP